MSKSKWIKTQYTGVYKYETKKGIKYGIRLRYQNENYTWKEKSESGFDTIKAARKRKVELENIVNNKSSAFKGDKLTFKQWFERYFELMEPTWSAETKVKVLTIYNNHLKEFDNVILSKLTLANYQRFINKKLYEADYSVIYVKTLHGVMMTIINASVKYELLDKNTLTGVSIQKQQQNTEKHIELEVLKLLDARAFDVLTPTEHAMYILMRIGWRRGEVLGLTKGAVKIINENLIEVSVTQTKTRHVEVNTPKTTSSYRTNTLKGVSAHVLANALTLAGSVYKDNHQPFTDDSRVFVNKKTKTHSTNKPQSILDKLSQGTDVRVTPHMLRHTFASQAVAAGMSLVEVAKWLGHTKIDMTLNTYSHSTNEAQTKLADFVSFG